MSKSKDVWIQVAVIAVVIGIVVLLYFYGMYFLDMIAWVFLESTEGSVLFQ